MSLYHYSAEPFTLDPSRVYEQLEGYLKPHGLWLSVEEGTPDDHGWKQWCEGAEFSLGSLEHRTRIALRDANILLIEDATSLDAFTRAYQLSPCYDGDSRIDWPRVVARYDGILIAPCLWERRMTRHTFWYYRWDCASACIWNACVLDVAQDEVMA